MKQLEMAFKDPSIIDILFASREYLPNFHSRVNKIVCEAKETNKLLSSKFITDKERHKSFFCLMRIREKNTNNTDL